MRHVSSILVLISLLAAMVAAGTPLYEADRDRGQNPLYNPVSAAVITVVENASTTAARSGALSDGMYVLEQDGDDLVLRKRPGRTKYADITLKKGYARCVLGGGDCDDGDGDAHPDAAYRMNKAELIDAIASKAGITDRPTAQRDLGLAEQALDMFVANVPPGHITVLKAQASVKAAGPFVVQWKAAVRDSDSDGDGISDCPVGQKARETAKRTACDALDPDDDDTVPTAHAGLDRKFQQIATTVSPAARVIEGFPAQSGVIRLTGRDRALAAAADASSISKRSARTGRNPQTGKEIQIAAKNVVR